MDTTHFNIVIIGGGIAGCSAALSLMPYFSVCLVDKGKQANERIGESLAPASMRILKELGVLNDLKPHESDELFLQNLGMQSYWGSDQVTLVDHLSNPDGFGLNLNRTAFEKHLQQLVEQKGVKCLWHTQLDKVEREKNSSWNLSYKRQIPKQRLRQIL